MGLLDEVKRAIDAPDTPDEHLYAQALSELAEGNARQGLWAKAIAECQGDEKKAAALYLRLRVQSLREDEQLERNRRSREEQQKQQTEREREQRLEAKRQLELQAADNKRKEEIRRNYGFVGLFIYVILRPVGAFAGLVLLSLLVGMILGLIWVGIHVF